MVTPNAVRALSRVADALSASAGGAWTLTGPFGTGKSAFCVFLSHLLASSKDPLTADFIRRLRQSDRRLAERLFPNDRHRTRLQPVTISGASESLQRTVLRALADGNLASAALPQRISRQLRGLHRRAESGERVSSSEVAELLQEIVSAVGAARSGPRGLLLIIDELGKLLEYAAGNPQRSDVFLLQQIAELAARSEGRLLLIGVLHQDFRGYAAGLPPSDRAEWEKIRGRFDDIVFDEPPSQLLRFVALAWARMREAEGIRQHPEVAKHLKARAARLWEHELAPPGLDLIDGLKLLELAAPLHPLTATLIGPLFRRVGQNERSAFSFLVSDDPSALRAFSRATNNAAHRLYDVVDLYGYLTNAIGNGLLHTADAKRWAEAFEAEARHPRLSPHAVLTLRAVALLNIASRWYPLRPTRETLVYALDERLSSEDLDRALRDLQRQSIVVHRRYNDSYTLWEGSDVDVDARLEEGRSRLGKTATVATLLGRHHRARPLLARRHAFERGTLRFFGVEFAHADELGSLAPEPGDHDGRIVVVLPSRGSERTLDDTDCARFDARTLFLLLPPQDRLFEFALELGAIDWVRANTRELENDATARRELNARRIEVERSLDGLVYQLLVRGSHTDGRWLIGGKTIHIRSSRQLSERLSEICDGVFNEAPRIDNEMVNRRELSSAAAAARGALVKRMIECWTLPDLGIDGDPPERSIYRSILSVEGGLSLHRKGRNGELAFRRPPSSSSALPVYQAIERFVEGSADSGTTLADLFEMLRRPPYGLRDGVIPIFLCAVLIARESDVALYEDGAFCPSISAAVFERLIKAPARFTVRRWEVTGVRGQVFRELERIVGDPSSAASPGKAHILSVVRPMLRFMGSLPEYTSRTGNISTTTTAVRAAFGEATEPDALLFTDLPRACGLDPFVAAQRGRAGDIRTYRDRLEHAFAELRLVYPSLVASTFSAIGDAFGVSDGSKAVIHLQERAGLLAQYAVERDMKMFIDRICAPETDAEQWTEGVAALVAERPMPKWRDEDQARFLVRLNQFARRFTLLEATLEGQPMRTTAASSIRVSLTGTAFGQFDHAVHLTKRTTSRVAKLHRSLEEVLGKAIDRNVAVAALCESLRQRIDLNSPPGSHNGKRS
ncbi:MAG: hypothetical protein IT430_17305 [Phycisphaerales bacterium]|nr:hypothetical protein [Phycisphaerales bacterium]